MADRKGLGVIGVMLGVVTAVVILIAGAVVHAHVDGRMTLEGAPPATSSSRSISSATDP